MVEMPETWVSLLGALLGGPIAWQSPRELADALGRDEGDTTDLLASMDEAGWLAVWEIDGGVVVTLSALGAERLRVRLVEPAQDHAPRWSPRGGPEPREPRARNVCTHERAADLAFVIDPRPTPDLAAERAEVVARRALDPGAAAENLPWPTLLLGQGLTPWPGPGRDTRVPCPACGSATLRPHEYCLCCDRWGLDGRLTDARGGGPPRPGRRQGPPNEQAEGAAQRARRKSRRRRKLAGRDADARRGDPRRPPGANGHVRDGTPLA